MAEAKDLKTEVLEDMKGKHIDVDLSLQILENYNKGAYAGVKPVEVSEIPEIDSETIIDMTEDLNLFLEGEKAEQAIAKIDPDIRLSDYGSKQGHSFVFKEKGLHQLGRRLYPFLSYGVLNGGSATSYADEKKNRSFNAELYSLYKEEIESIGNHSKGKAKGLSPAFINPDGSFGPSFLELKMRSLLIGALDYQLNFEKSQKPLAPMFQMSSVYNNEELAQSYDEYREKELLGALIGETGIDICEVLTGVQPLQAAMTHSSKGAKKEIFTNAFGEPDNTLPLPGGHGRNFAVLKDVYKELHRQGKHFVYLGNVDNLGFTVSPTSLAYLALTGKQAGFDFSFRTPVDVKGGILVRDTKGRLNCADIGVGISREEVYRAESGGKSILFNCATGLFNLDYLISNIDYIIENLPMRISDQDKDAGKYSQAEQVTWEVLGLLDDFLVFGVDKYDRFLAAKLLTETLMTSGLKLDHHDYPSDEDPSKDMKRLAGKLHQGLEKKLKTVYGMKKQDGSWVPRNPTELKESLS